MELSPKLIEIEYKRKRTLNHRAERAYGYRSNLLMMDIKYDFKANPFKEKNSDPVLYPAVVVKETITTDHIVKELSKHSAYWRLCGGSATGGGRYGCIPLRQGKNVRLTDWVRSLLALSLMREVTTGKRWSASVDKESELPSGTGVKSRGYVWIRIYLRAEFGFLPTGKKYTKEEHWNA